MLKLLLTIILSLVILFWIISFLSYIPNSFKNEFGLNQPGTRVFIKGDGLKICSINVFNPCVLQYRFQNVNQVELDKITKQMKGVEFSDWRLVDEFWVGNYRSGRHDISREGMMVADKDINNHLHLWLVYYPSNNTLDALEFRH